MRVFKYILVAIMIGGIVFPALSCTGNTGSTSTPKPQIVTVKRGNISINVTGTGNLALENKQELSFGQTGIASQATTAKISEVDVVAGQTVKKDQVLAKADTTDYQDQLITDQHNLDSAMAGLAQAKANVAQAQANVAQTQLTLIQDQANLLKSQQTLSAQQDVQNIQNQIDTANIQLQTAQAMFQQSLLSTGPNAFDAVQYWQNQINYLSVDTKPNSKNTKHNPDGGQIARLQKQMSDLLTDPAHAGAASVSNGAESAFQIQQDVLAIQQAQQKIVTDQANLVTAQANVTIAQNNVVLAQNKVDDAQTTFNNDKNSAQEIDAPFDGLIAQVNISQGQIVQRNATLIEIADPTKFVANILVTEQDVMSLKTGDNATVSFSALTGQNFPARITQIAPLATVQQGVVNYQITVELTSLNPVSSPARTPATTTGGTPSAGTSQSTNLKDGLSVTVTVPVQEKDNILILASRAITRQGQNSTVQLVKGTTTETVTVKTGLTDGTNTEITSGLNEGDQVLVKAATTTATTSGFGGPPGGLRIP